MSVEVRGLSVKINEPQGISATIKRFKKLDVSVGAVAITTPGYTPPTYEGETEVTPDKSTQTLDTNGYFVKDNITVHPIPDEYIVPEGTKEIVSNGEHDVKDFEKVDVNVPIPDGYIKPQGVKEIVSNGDHDVTEVKTARVNVPNKIPDGYLKPSGTKQITSNGTHDVKQYESAEVNVPIPDGYIKPSGTKSITSNGEHDVNSYQKVNVNVPNKIPDGYYDASGLNVDESKVLAGEIYIDEEGYKIGEMPNKGAVNATIQGLVSGTSAPQPFTIPEGYHNGQGKVSISSNVKTLHDNIAQALRQKGQTVSLNYDPLQFPALIGYIQTSEDLNAVLTEQETLIEELKEELRGKAAGGGEAILDDFLTNKVTAIDSDITSIVSYGSYGRTALKTVNLPKCTEINSYAFRGCSGITSVDVPLTNTLGTYAFYGCTNLASINAPKAKSLGTYVFYKAGLESVNLPLATSVPQSAFFQNENLVKADFGVASKINQSAFANCYKLVALILRKNDGICALGTATNALQDTPIAEGKGYVYVHKQWLSDDDATKDYRRATNWSGYADLGIFRAIEDYPEICGG